MYFHFLSLYLILVFQVPSSVPTSPQLLLHRPAVARTSRHQVFHQMIVVSIQRLGTDQQTASNNWCIPLPGVTHRWTLCILNGVLDHFCILSGKLESFDVPLHFCTSFNLSSFETCLIEINLHNSWERKNYVSQSKQPAEKIKSKMTLLQVLEGKYHGNESHSLLH